MSHQLILTCDTCDTRVLMWQCAMSAVRTEHRHHISHAGGILSSSSSCHLLSSIIWPSQSALHLLTYLCLCYIWHPNRHLLPTTAGYKWMSEFTLSCIFMHYHCACHVIRVISSTAVFWMADILKYTLVLATIHIMFNYVNWNCST